MQIEGENACKGIQEIPTLRFLGGCSGSASVRGFQNISLLSLVAILASDLDFSLRETES